MDEVRSQKSLHEAEARELACKIVEAKDVFTQITDDVKEEHAKLDSLREQVIDTQQEVERAEQKITKLDRVITELEQSCENIERKEREHADRQVALEERVLEQQAAYAEAQSELETLRSALTQTTCDLNDNQILVVKAQEQTELKEKQRAELELQLKEYEITRSAAEKELEEQQRRIADQSSQLKRLEAAVLAAEEQRQVGLRELADIERRRQWEKSRTEELTLALEVGLSQEKALHAVLEKIAEQHADIHEQLRTAESTREQVTKELEEEAMLLARLRQERKNAELSMRQLPVAPVQATPGSIVLLDTSENPSELTGELQDPLVGVEEVVSPVPVSGGKEEIDAWGSVLAQL